MVATARNAFPTPASSAVPDVPVDMKGLADAIDTRIPYVTTSTPAHIANLVWHNPTTKLTQISDGTAWQPVTAVNWTSYTPAFVMDVSNGTKTGWYAKIGTQVTVNAHMLATTGVSLGTGTITVSLPFTAATRTNHIWHGSGMWVAGGNHTVLHIEVLSGASTAQIWAVSATNHVLASPGFLGFTFASGDRISTQFTYESV